MSDPAHWQTPPVDWPPSQLVLPQQNTPGLLGDVRELPQRFSDNLQPRRDAYLSDYHLRKSFDSKATSNISEVPASEGDFESRHSGVSRDSGYYSTNGGSSASSVSKPHRHWCLICTSPRAFMTCDGWKRHMKEHEVMYLCLACASHEDPSFAKAPTFTRKASLVTHLKLKHNNPHGSRQADSWCRKQKRKFYSCGFCICLFATMIEYLNHIDDAHYKHSQTLEDWDRNKVILGLLQQPLVQDAWRRILASDSIPEQLVFDWDAPQTSDLQRRLEVSEDTPEALANSALMRSMYAMKQDDMDPPVSQHDGLGRETTIDSEFSALRLQYFPKAFDDRKWHSEQQSRSFDLSEIKVNVPPGWDPDPWRLRNRSRQDPWTPLRIAGCDREHETHESSQSQANTSNAATSSQSERSSASPTQPPYGTFDLNIARAKHELMVTLMKEVYTMFDSRWQVNARTCANPNQESSGTQAQRSKTEAPRVDKNPKKRRKDKDSSPPGDGNGKREKRDDSDAGLQ